MSPILVQFLGHPITKDEWMMSFGTGAFIKNATGQVPQEIVSSLAEKQRCANSLNTCLRNASVKSVVYEFWPSPYH